MSRIVFLDTETTGLSPESGDRIIEVGCVEMVGRRLTGRTKHFYVNPQRANHEDAVKVHGLTDEFLADQPLFAAVAEDLLDFLAGAEVVIHNASFDVGFLNEEMKRLGRPPFPELVAGIVDSLAMARDTYPGKSNSLDALCRRLEVDNTARTVHGALLDAGLLAEVYIRMTRGQDALLIEADATGDDLHVAGAAIDLSTFALPVIAATIDERAAHAAWLADLDKASGGRAVWRVDAMA